MVKRSLKKAVPTKKFTVRLNKEKWTVLFYTPKQFEKLFKDAVGVCDYNHRTGMRNLLFRGPKVSKDTIAHELCHAYLSYRDMSRCSVEDVEEHVCETIGKKYKILFELTNYIYNKIYDFT